MIQSVKKKEMGCDINIPVFFDETDQKTFKLMKETYKNKRYVEFTIFRWHIEFKWGHLSVELASKSGQPERAVKGLNVKTEWSILQRNRRMARVEWAILLNTSETSKFRIPHNNF